MVVKFSTNTSKLKTFNLEENWSLTSSKAPKLHFVVFCEMHTASMTNKRLMQKESGCYMFMFSLETIIFYFKKILQFII